MIASLTSYIKTLLDYEIGSATTTDLIKEIKVVYNGEPRALNEANLPAITIEALDSAYEKMKGYYKGTYRIAITVKYPGKLLYGNTDNETVLVKQKVQSIIEGEGDTICGLDPKSIAGILSKKMCIVVDGCVIANDLYMESVKYETMTDGGFVGYQGKLTIVLFNAQLKY